MAQASRYYKQIVCHIDDLCFVVRVDIIVRRATVANRAEAIRYNHSKVQMPINAYSTTIYSKDDSNNDDDDDNDDNAPMPMNNNNNSNNNNASSRMSILSPDHANSLKTVIDTIGVVPNVGTECVSRTKIGVCHLYAVRRELFGR